MEKINTNLHLPLHENENSMTFCNFENELKKLNEVFLF